MATAAQSLRDAQTLALFSNARTAAEADYFHHNYGSFFPRNFWNWQIRQLEEGVPIFSPDAPTAQAVERLRRAPLIPFWQAFQGVLRGAWQLGFPLEECVRLISSAAVADRLYGETDVEPDLSSYPVWPYQRAVMLLGVEPWRARFCPLCGKRFVADKPARRFCSDACASKARKHSRRAWWSEHGKEWRVNRSKGKRVPTAKGKASRRTKR